MSIPEFTCWTIHSVREEMPDVPLEYEGETYMAKISGRMTDWPKLNIKVGRTWLSWEFAWLTIVQILNTNGKGIV